MSFEPEIESDAARLSTRLAERFDEIVSGGAMIEAAREQRAATCDDVMAALKELEGCDLSDLLTEHLPDAK